MIGDVNFTDQDTMPRPRWLQWGTRLGASLFDDYRYAFLRTPFTAVREDRYAGPQYLHQDATVIYPRKTYQLCFMWTTWSGLRIYWEEQQ